MTHAILHGEYELTIDDKNRLLIPSDVRHSLSPERDGTRFFLIIGANRKPWLYPEKSFERLVSDAAEELSPDADEQAFDQMFFAMASVIEPDKQGRLLLPEKTLRRTNTGKEVTLIGARNRLEIWNRAEWEQQFEENFARLQEITKNAKDARRANAADRKVGRE